MNKGNNTTINKRVKLNNMSKERTMLTIQNWKWTQSQTW